MAISERFLELDRTFNEIEQSGGQVWVEATWKEKRVLLNHRIDIGGRLHGIMVLLPGEATPSVVKELALTLAKHWDGEISSTGTWAGTDYRGGKAVISSYYYVVDPCDGRRAEEGIGNMHGIVRHYGDNNGHPVLTDPKIVGADVVVFKEG